MYDGQSSLSSHQGSPLSPYSMTVFITWSLVVSPWLRFPCSVFPGLCVLASQSLGLCFLVLCPCKHISSPPWECMMILVYGIPN